MRRFSRDDLMDARSYEATRDALRRHVVTALKPPRRHLLAGRLLLAFENREIARYHLLERVRAAPSTALAALERAHAELAPPGALACALIIEVADPAERAARLAAWGDVPSRLYLRFDDGRRAFATPRAGDEAGPACVVWRLTFRTHRADHIPETTPVSVGCDHPELTDEAPLDPVQRAALAADLTESNT